MSESLYDLYQEKVGVNLKGHKEVCEEVLRCCKIAILEGKALPYSFIIENVSDEPFNLLSPALSTRGVIASAGAAYTVNGVTHMDVYVREFRKVRDEMPEPPKPPEPRQLKRWWEWK